MTYLIKKSIDNVVVEGISEIGKAFMESSKEDWKDGGGRESPNVAKAGPNEQACYGLLKTRFGCLYVGQTVTYSVQPLLQNGLGMATRSGILTVDCLFGLSIFHYQFR